MLVYAVVAVALAALIFFVSPKVHRVHAAKVKQLPTLVRPSSHYPMHGFIVDEAGKRISLKARMIGLVDGGSCEFLGIRDGSEFIADLLNDIDRENLKRDDIVVVDAPTVKSSTGKRLRVIESVDKQNHSVKFRPDAFGDRRRDRPFSEISARVRFLREMT